MNIFITDFFFDVESLVKNGHKINTKENKTFEPKNTEIVITRSKTYVNSKFLDKFPNLKLMITTTSGFDHIDIDECKKRKITCAYTPDANAPSCAELTLTLALIALKDIGKSFENIELGDWRKGISTSELGGKTWGIVGFGRVGKRLNQLLSAFQVKVLSYDPYITEFESTERVELENLFSNSDIVSVHVPETKKTNGMVTKDLISKMKKDSILINTARASVIEETEIKFALNQGVRVCLDVFKNEPLQGFELIKHKNLILTPHIGGYTKEALKRASENTLDIIREFTSKSVVTKNLLPPKAPWYLEN